MRILVLSPHPDDAVFSCCDHMLLWKKKGIDVTVCSIFTSYKTNKMTRGIYWYIQNSGYSDQDEFETARRNEDAKALKYLSIKLRSLNFTDGAFRCQKNGELVYPKFSELFEGSVSRIDKEILNQLLLVLKVIESKYDLVISPLSIGNHVDHILTRDCAVPAVTQKKLGFYFDVPYYFFVENWEVDHALRLLKSQFSIKWTSLEKKIAMNLYKSQKKLILNSYFNIFFNEKITYFPEIVFTPPF